MIQHWRDLTSQQRYLFLFLVIVFFRAIFSLNVGLIDDEAYHWSWSKDLMLSYYDHPGVIAWLNAASTSVFGDTLLGVRLPCFLFFCGTVLLSFFLVRDLFDEKAAVFTALMLLFTPFWGFGGYVASPEPPFMFFWVLAAWIFWQGVRPDSRRWSAAKTWLLLGVVMGLGLNSKFIMALVAPGFGIYLLATPSRRRDLLTLWPWMGFLLATLICLPIFVWNIEFDWPGFKYQFQERHAGESFSALRWLGWWGAQWGLMTPLLYPLLLLSFAVSLRRWRQERWRLIFCLALPSFLVFYPQPFFADYKPHWSGPAYLYLCFGAGALWSQGLFWKNRWWLKAQSKRLKWAFIVFLGFVNVVIYSPFVYPFWPKVYRAVYPGHEWNIRWDLSNEFYGWQDIGRIANRRQRELHAETNSRPFLAALRYETTAQLYWGTQQKIYMLNQVKSHYTVVHKHKHEWEQLLGLDALIVTTEKYSSDPMNFASFDSCTPEEHKIYRGDELSRIFTLWHCRNFKGGVK